MRAPSPCFHQPAAMPRAAGAVTHQITTTSARAVPSASRDRPRCRHTAAGTCGVQPAERSRDLVHDGADQHRKGYLPHGLACHGRHHSAGHRHSPCMALIDVVTSGVRGSLRQTSNPNGRDRQGNESGGKTPQTLELCFGSETQPDTGPECLCVTTLAGPRKSATIRGFTGAIKAAGALHGHESTGKRHGTYVQCGGIFWPSPDNHARALVCSDRCGKARRRKLPGPRAKVMSEPSRSGSDPDSDPGSDIRAGHVRSCGRGPSGYRLHWHTPREASEAWCRRGCRRVKDAISLAAR
jgi:hypothetical protein